MLFMLYDTFHNLLMVPPEGLVVECARLAIDCNVFSPES